MINFSVMTEYTINEDVLIETYQDEYERYMEQNSLDDVEEFVLYMVEQYGAEEIGAEEDYSEVMVYG